MSYYEYIVISDLDGTLCNSNEVLSKKTIDRLLAFQEKYPKVLFTFSTGRPWSDAKEIYESLKLKSYISCLNGSYIYNPHTNHLLTSCLSIKFLEHLLAFGPTLSSLFKGALLTNSGTLPIESDSPRAVLEALKKTNSSLIGVKLFYREEDEERVNEIIEEVKRFKPSPRTSIFFYPKLINLEIQSDQFDKSSFVTFISNYLGVKQENILTFGDNHNDIPMMKGVRSYALSNAIPLLKQEANIISRYSNDEDGVVRELELFFNNLK